MDKPLTPAENLADALTGLALSLQTLRDALEVLACEIIVAPREVRRRTEVTTSPRRGSQRFAT